MANCPADFQKKVRLCAQDLPLVLRRLRVHRANSFGIGVRMAVTTDMPELELRLGTLFAEVRLNFDISDYRTFVTISVSKPSASCMEPLAVGCNPGGQASGINNTFAISVQAGASPDESCSGKPSALLGGLRGLRHPGGNCALQLRCGISLIVSFHNGETCTIALGLNLFRARAIVIDVA